jgi:glucokinase
MAKNNLILAGDIGGTKTNLAVFSKSDGLAKPLASATFASAKYSDLAAILRAFLDDAGLQVGWAGFGVAGPVFDGRAKITKLPWTIDSRSIQDEFGLNQVAIVNDLVATAYGLSVLQTADFVSLNTGNSRPEGAQIIVAPGTGLGETFMLWENGTYRAYPSEGGHTPFAPANELQDRLLGYLRPRHLAISNDLVGSGRGIPLLYEFLRDAEHIEEDEEVRQELATCGDQTPVIVRAALSTPASPLCVATLDLFVDILASESANLALKIMATGGIFLGGGMPPRILSFLQKRFMTAFIGCDVLRDLLADVPVQVIMEPLAAMFGAASLVGAVKN